MARDRKACQKAIAEAWKREQELVLQGKATREWTEEQQLDIIELGKAFDDDGIAFEGQHMKSALAYPDQQGNPDNIQLLSKNEHLAAHMGDFRNPTNWYYDPVSLETICFGDGAPTACKVIELISPIAIQKSNTTKDISTSLESKKEKSSDKASTSKVDDHTVYTRKQTKPHRIRDWLKEQWEYAKKHPFKTVGKVIDTAAVIGGIYKTGKAIRTNRRHSPRQVHHSLKESAFRQTKQPKALTNDIIRNIGEKISETVQQNDMSSLVAKQALDSGTKAIKGLNDYSVLLTKGYNTHLPQDVRREILTNLLSENGKQPIVQLLRFLISTRSGNKLGKYENAISTWKDDLDFILKK